MSGILNEVEVRKQRREEQKIDQLKKAGKSKEEIQKELESSKKKSDGEKKEVVLCKTLYDHQKRKLDRLMNNPSKDVYIPQPRKEWKPRDPAEFVRHVMGSSAGAGSGEFHVYRNNRKRENKRQEYLEKKTVKEELDGAFQAKMDDNKEKADQSTSKKRAKRQKKKQNKIMAKKAKKMEDHLKDKKKADEESSDEEDDEDGNGDGGNDEKEPEEPHFVIGGK